MAFERSEQIGLGTSVAVHAVLLGILSIGIATRSELRMPSEPIAVQLADEVGLTSTAPDPDAAAATATAPEIGDLEEPAAPPEQPVVRPQERIPPPPSQRPIERPRATPAPTPRASPPPPPRPVSRDDRRRPDRPTPAERQGRAPRLGENFLRGVTDEASTSQSQQAPAQQAGPAVVASLVNEVRRQLKPHWQAPSGADVELLRTELEIRLDRSGNIIGEPRLVGQTGVNASNRQQSRLHIEQAIKAAKLAAPFRLPDEYYDTWKVIRPVFDKRL
ncbi:MAG: hypothetical protein R3E02_11755 [Blastomonas sp.]